MCSFLHELDPEEGSSALPRDSNVKEKRFALRNENRQGRVWW